MIKLTKIQIAWLAGIIEGEGCINLHNDNIRLQINMSDKDIIERISSMLKVSFYTLSQRYSNGNKCKIMYTICPRENISIPILKLIKPYMGKRRKEKIEIALKSYENKQQIKKKKIIRNEKIIALYKTGKYTYKDICNLFSMTSGNVYYILYHFKK